MTTDPVNPAPRLDNQDPALFGQTPSQTVGPFFHYGLPWKGGADLVGQSDMGARPELFPEEHYVLNRSPPRGAVGGETIVLEGVVYDAEGKPVPDAMIEIWQANAAGRYASPDDDRPDVPLDEGFIGFGRAATDENGLYRFRTVRPGPVPGPGNRLQAVAHRRRRVRPRPDQAPGHAHLFRGRGRERRRPDPGPRAGRAPRHPGRPQGAE